MLINSSEASHLQSQGEQGNSSYYYNKNSSFETFLSSLCIIWSMICYWIHIRWIYLATVIMTPIATSKHPSSWLDLYRLLRKITDKISCQTRKVCKKKHYKLLIMKYAYTWNHKGCKTVKSFFTWDSIGIEAPERTAAPRKSEQIRPSIISIRN